MYTITWDDMNKTTEHCELECVQGHQEIMEVQRWECYEAEQLSGTLRVPPAVESTIESSTVHISPVEAKGKQCVLVSDYETVFLCDRYENKCWAERGVLGDADLIDLVIQGPGVSGLPGDKIELVLRTGPRVDGWKAILVDGNPSVEIWNKREEGVIEQRDVRRRDVQSGSLARIQEGQIVRRTHGHVSVV